MLLPYMHLFEAAGDCTGDRRQDVVQVHVVPPGQGFDVFPADGIGLTGRVGLDGSEGRHDFQSHVLGFRQRQHDGIRRFLSDFDHHVLTLIGILDGVDGEHPFARGNQRERAGIGRRCRRHQCPFLIPQFHRGLCRATQVRVLHVPGYRLAGRSGVDTLRHSPKQHKGNSKENPCPPDGLSR